MAKVIAEKAEDAGVKQVEIKHTKVMKDAEGKDVTVVDWVEQRPVDEMIADAEARVTELKADIVEYKKIKG